jgi:hypothetical protein
MARSFASFTLSPDEVGVVFPLVNAVLPDVELATWQSFARHFTDKPPATQRGAIGLRNAAGYVCGLLIYRTTRDLRYGSVLAVDLFTALDLVNEEAAALTLLEAAEAKARELACSATFIRLDVAQKALLQRFVARGLRPAASLFCQQVGRVNPS